MSVTRIVSPALSAEIDAQGAQLSALRDVQGRDLLWSGDPAVWKGRAPILFPIVGTLNGGEYRLDGKTYHLPRHGFARDRLFALAQSGPERALFRLCADVQTRAVYPFDFVLEMEFALRGATLAMTATIFNKGATPMPASFGFHPAFRWPLPYGAPRADHRITFAQDEPAPARRLDRDGLLRPDPVPTPVRGDTLMLDDALFVEDVVIFDRLASRSLTYGGVDGPSLEIGFAGMPELGLWTKPGADFVCIEPWAGIADPAGFSGDFTAKPGSFLVAPGAARACAMTVTLRV